MGRSLGLEICWQMEIKIDETYHVSFICTRSFGENSLLHLSYIEGEMISKGSIYFPETSCAFKGQQQLATW